MRFRTHVVALACAGALVAACASEPESQPEREIKTFIEGSPQFNAFLDRLQQACAGQSIGPSARVDDLINEPSSSRGDFFISLTRRLFFGGTSTQDYATGVSAFLNGWPSDPGVQCVIREYDRQRQFTTPPPGSSPPQR